MKEKACNTTLNVVLFTQVVNQMFVLWKNEQNKMTYMNVFTPETTFLLLRKKYSLEKREAVVEMASFFVVKR